LVVKCRHGFFRQSADVEFERVGAATEAAHEFSAENGRHAGREAAIGGDRDTTFLRLFGKGELLADYRVVSSQVGEMAAGFEGRFSEAEVEEVGNCRECRVVAAHQLGGGWFVGGFELDGADLLVPRDFVYSRGAFFGALEIIVGG